MSFHRFVFYCAVIGGWAAFAGWLLSEAVFLHRSSDFGPLSLVFTAALVGGAIGGGLNLLAGAAQGSLKDNLPRLWIGFGGGLIGGALGGLAGNLLYSLLPGAALRAIGWMLMGTGIGSVEGLYDRSWKKIRNGLIGGAIGGFLGGLLFNPIFQLIGGNMSSRATAFVILGLCIGLFVGLAQVILKEAWLTVVEGFRPGRQVVLNFAETILGTSEKAQLPFIAFGAKGVEPVHLRIIRQPNGGFLLQDNNSRTGTMVNGARVDEPVHLNNGDLIQLGPNTVRYCERFRQVAEDAGSLSKAVPAEPAPAKPAKTAKPSPPLRAAPAMGKLVQEAIKPGTSKPPPVPVQAALAAGRRRAPKAPMPQPAVPARKIVTPPKPPPLPPPPASAPVVPSPVVPSLPADPAWDEAPIVADAESDNSCPICGREIRGKTGKRLCDNCGIKF